MGDILPVQLEAISNRIALVPGDIRLAEFEQKLSDAWPRCNDRDPAAFRVVSGFYRVVEAAAKSHDAELLRIDVGPNLGAINRCALIAAEYVATPLAADLFSLQGLRNLGPTLDRWRLEWKERLGKNPVAGLSLPAGAMQPVGYVVTQPNLYGGQVLPSHVDAALERVLAPAA